MKWYLGYSVFRLGRVWVDDNILFYNTILEDDLQARELFRISKRASCYLQVKCLPFYVITSILPIIGAILMILDAKLLYIELGIYKV